MMEWLPATLMDVDMLIQADYTKARLTYRTDLRGLGLISHWPTPTDVQLVPKRGKTVLILGGQGYTIAKAWKAANLTDKPYCVVVRIEGPRGSVELRRRAQYKKDLQPLAKRLHLV
ncbi:hypothetical protein [Alicyclobacillus herbarius]|uniref:hypothetical protein n=1 Tax=Alicyclobacillus herbarius TaxID=122960 RepID=UPI00041D6A09|nr:hypothetical protein [Alicyclobacillus herbarius]